MASFSQHHPLPEGAASDPWVTRWFDDWGNRANDLGVAWDAAGELRGACWAREVQPVRLVDPSGRQVPELLIAVRADWRGRGVARTLLEDLLAAARREGWTAVALTVSAKNEGAARLYRAVGFVEHEKPDGLLVMSFTL